MDVSSCLLQDGKTVDGYAMGDIVTVTGYIRHQSGHPNDYYISYNNGGESGKEAPKIIAWEQGQGGEKVPEPEAVEKTLAEFIALENKKDKAYLVSAKIKAFKSGATKDEYGNMTLTDDTNDLLIYGSTATATALIWNDADAYNFSNPKDFLTNEVTSALNLGDTVKMKLIRDDFNTTIEGKGIVVDVTPGGGGEEVPEPEVVERSLADFIAGENTKAKAYLVSGEIKAFKTGATKDQYGNMTLTDGTNDLLIYGASATASALAWNKVDAYDFQNPQDFLTNEVTNALKVGDTVKMKLIRDDYKTTIEGKGIIVDVTPCVIELTGITVSGSSSVNLFGQTVDQTVQLTAAPDPAGAELGNVTWACQDTSGNPASVDPDSGLVTIPVDYVALDGASKSFTVTATNGEKTSDPFTITVKNEDDSGGGGGQSEPVVLTKDSITKVVEDGAANQYATYNGGHDFTDYAFTTSSVMPNTYATQKVDVIQFKAKEGSLTFTKGSFSKVTLQVYSTYDWDLTIGVNGNYGVNSEMNANRVATEYSTTSSGKTYTVYLYTLVVTFENPTEGISIVKHADKSGAGYVASITLE